MTDPRRSAGKGSGAGAGAGSTTGLSGGSTDGSAGISADVTADVAADVAADSSASGATGTTVAWTAAGENCGASAGPNADPIVNPSAGPGAGHATSREHGAGRAAGPSADPSAGASVGATAAPRPSTGAESDQNDHSPADPDPAPLLTRAPGSAPRFRDAAPFWLSLLMLPLAALGVIFGGWFVVLLPLYGWWVFTLLDVVFGLNPDNADPDTPEASLFWHRLITLIWPPLQFALIFGSIWWVTRSDHLGWLETTVLFFGIGSASGTVGIVYAHELMHQRNRLERRLADLLLAMVFYSHFRSEHLLVHHRHVGTPADAVTARYNEGFHHYFWRVLSECPRSAWRAEIAMLTRRGRGAFHPKNPFWRYAVLQAAMLSLAWLVGGGLGLALFGWQALVAVWQLELTNYVEHYGLTREHLGDGRYEHVKPHHSWNAAHTASNWLLINLQRHSDHHYKPDRRFPLLQSWGSDEAPQLPFGYPLMATIAMVPPLWRRRMNPRVQAWRKRYYPHISDWSAYKAASNPRPRGSV
jgi:alkane 1-monooxygenase